MFETSDKNELKKKITKGKVLVLFYASWCPDCTAFLPKFNLLDSKSIEFDLVKAKIDEDENPIWEEFKIEFVPTLVLYEEGKEKIRVEEVERGVFSKSLEKIIKHK